jgi:hypothetical protein
MRYMMIVRAKKESESGALPDEKMISDMMKFNEDMVRAGVLISAEGLHPSSKGVRIKFSGSNRTVVNGPFPNPNELIAGYWIIQVKSKEEAIEWARRSPNPMHGESEIELRQIYEAEDFGPAFTPELKKQEERLREKVGKR